MLENEEENIIDIPPMDFTLDQRGVGCVLFDSMLKYKDNVAQIDGLTGEEDLYRNLMQRSVRVALALQKKGIEYGDVISICSYNHLDSCTPLLAALFLGAPLCGIDECLGADDAANSLILIKPKVIFVQQETVTIIEAALEKILHSAEIIVFGATNKHTPFSELLKPIIGEENFMSIPVKALTNPAMIIFTNGSTGVPKPICYNHFSILYQTANLINCNYDWKVSLEYTSPFWAVFGCFFIITTMLGNTRLIYHEFDESIAWHFAKYKTSIIFLSNIEVLTMCKIGRPKNLSLDYLKYVMLAGNFLSESQLNMIKELFREAHILYAYGQSELPCPLTIFKPTFKNE